MDYQLLDCGDLYKIEIIGPYTLARPEPQAIWPMAKPLDQWKTKVDAWYERKRSEVVSNKEESGQWLFNTKLPDNWVINIGTFGPHEIKAKVATTAFKHIGIFPEQASNWQFISDHSQQQKLSGSVLNLFGYTGVASLVAAASGFKVVHVDAVKQVVNWANENRTLSNLEPNISWVVEDAMKYIGREINRSKKYTGIIVDPPAYGRGPNGEKWILERDLFELLISCKALLEMSQSFLILNVYSLNMTPMLLRNILMEAGLWNDRSEVLEQGIPYGENRILPLGVCARVVR